MERKGELAYIFGDFGRSWINFKDWGAKENTFRELRNFHSEIWEDRCIIFRDQGSTDPPGSLMTKNCCQDPLVNHKWLRVPFETLVWTPTREVRTDLSEIRWWLNKCWQDPSPLHEIFWLRLCRILPAVNLRLSWACKSLASAAYMYHHVCVFIPSLEPGGSSINSYVSVT